MSQSPKFSTDSDIENNPGITGHSSVDDSVIHSPSQRQEYTIPIPSFFTKNYKKEFLGVYFRLLERYSRRRKTKRIERESIENPAYIENLWRPNFEFFAAIFWFMSAVTFYNFNIVPDTNHALRIIEDFFIYFAVILCGYRFSQGWDRAYRQARAITNDLLIGNVSMFYKNRDKNDVLLGRGFEWGPEHTQRATQIMAMSGNRRRLLESPITKLMVSKDRILSTRKLGGQPWIDAIGDPEEIRIPFETFEGHLFVVGATGQGKTRILECLAMAALNRKDDLSLRQSVIVIDPKNDQVLLDRIRAEHKRQRRTGDLFYFHPSKPSESCRLDPCANWNKTSELATRIALLMPSDGGAGDNFISYAWRVVKIICDAMEYIGEKPNLVKIKKYVVAQQASLFVRCATLHFQKILGDYWYNTLDIRQKKGKESRATFKYQNDLTRTNPDAMIFAYENILSDKERHSSIDGLLSLINHDKAHHSKMIQNILPILEKLTSPPLDKMLSPDFSDLDDDRPIANLKDIISTGKTIVIALDSLPDQQTGTAIGTIIMADLCACAGEKYNFAENPTRGAVNLFIDEANEVVCEPVISILNKSRGAGFFVTLLSQTINDLIDKTSESAAKKILGNVNSLIALKCTDTDTQEYVTGSFLDTEVKKISHTSSQSADTASSLDTYNVMNAYRLESAESPLVPTTLVGALPKLEYFARLSDGRVLKGKVPILVDK